MPSHTIIKTILLMTNASLAIADYLAPEVAFLIVNALYFKASWSVLFDEGVPQTFTTIDGQKTIVKMMTRTSLHNLVAITVIAMIIVYCLLYATLGV